MKQLKFNIGGHPFLIDDIIHLQNALIESVSNIIKPIANVDGGFPQVLLNGVVLTEGTPGNYTWTGGFLFIQDEIFEIDEQLVETPINDDFDLYIEETSIPPSPVTYENTSPEDVHVVRKLVPKNSIVEGFAGLVQFNTIENFRYLDRVQELLQNDGWTSISTDTGIGSVDEAVFYRIVGKTGGVRRVELRGVVTTNSTFIGNFQNFFDGLPTPSLSKYILVGGLNPSAVPRQVLFELTTGGVLRANANIQTVDTNTQYCFDGFTYFI